MAAREASRPRVTYVQYVALPEGGYNLLEGELLVTPSASRLHQKLQARLLSALLQWVEAEELGEVYGAPTDVVLRQADPAIVVQPDVLYVARNGQAKLTDAGVSGPPELAIEILSPSSLRLDGVRKRALYEAYGVHEYWLVSPESQQIEVLVLEAPGRYGLAHHFGPLDSLKTFLWLGFELSLQHLFRP